MFYEKNQNGKGYKLFASTSLFLQLQLMLTTSTIIPIHQKNNEM